MDQFLGWDGVGAAGDVRQPTGEAGGGGRGASDRASVDDLDAVSGIGPAMLVALEPLVAF
ncbi:hypothetical protein [Agrococcus jejuensis]|uniref:Uncharacterized protein n=1 Tax=Agrococcus jejuensis TaxID=399736 RepID=A0A1G8A4L1_9MICO|nr:hypothetical protein [Agrococcus jejuensis]SDH15884.1 hypothetical protein SAMN04489720_0246 [Agrococcus jejuensis]